MVKAGDSIPNVDLVEGSPGDKVNLSKELASGKGLIIGVPAAYSKYIPSSSKLAKLHSGPQLAIRPDCTDQSPGPACSATHVPGYISSDKLKNAGKVFVVSINDPFV